jgi:hypothetical protein
MRIRKFGTSEWQTIRCREGVCAFCLAGNLVKWSNVGDAIFLESESGEVHQLTVVRLPNAEDPGTVLCELSSAVEARAVLAAVASS